MVRVNFLSTDIFVMKSESQWPNCILKAMGYLFAVIVSVIGEVMVGFQRFAVFSCDVRKPNVVEVWQCWILNEEARDRERIELEWLAWSWRDTTITEWRYFVAWSLEFDFAQNVTQKWTLEWSRNIHQLALDPSFRSNMWLEMA
jgi:hypothetical protein